MSPSRWMVYVAPSGIIFKFVKFARHRRRIQAVKCLQHCGLAAFVLADKASHVWLEDYLPAVNDVPEHLDACRHESHAHNDYR